MRISHSDSFLHIQTLFSIGAFHDLPDELSFAVLPIVPVADDYELLLGSREGGVYDPLPLHSAVPYGAGESGRFFLIAGSAIADRYDYCVPFPSL